MKKNISIFLDHILESIKLIEEYIEGKNKTDFLESNKLQDSIIRRLEVIGEAIKNIPNEFKEKYKQIPWREITGMRDILIHQYFGVDLNLTWQVVDRDLLKLKKQIIEIKKEIQNT
ncbi:MAG: DUF86 domain-containing protein [Candidatus Thorarchaeota archaeon]